MVDVNKSVVARYKKGKDMFEIMVDCDKAVDYRSGKVKDIEDVVAGDIVFSSVQHNKKADSESLLKVFGTEEFAEIADEIIRHGEVQLTAEYKNKLVEEKRKKIIGIIHRNAVDPKTGLPHPLQRIEMLMKEAKVKVDEHKTAEAQVKDIVRKMTELVPIKFETRELAVKLPATSAAKAYHVLKEYGKMLKDEWQNDGSLVAVVELPAGMQPEFEDELNKLSQGEAEVKILNKK